MKIPLMKLPTSGRFVIVSTTAFSLAALLALAGLALASEFFEESVIIETAENPRVRLQVLDESEENVVQTWDLMGNDSTFSIRDITAGTTPVMIAAGLVNNLIFGAAGVGIGTVEPKSTLHVTAAAGGIEQVARFEVSDSPSKLLIINGTSTAGVFTPKIMGVQESANAALILDTINTQDVGSAAALVLNAAKEAGGPLVARPLAVFRNQNAAKVTIAANGDMFATSYNTVSSRSLKQDIVELDSAVAGQALSELTPVEFVYNDDATRKRRIGFIAEDVPEILATPDRKAVPLMDTVALVTRVVKDHQQAIEIGQAEITAQANRQNATASLLEIQQLALDLAADEVQQYESETTEVEQSLERLRVRFQKLEAQTGQRN